MNYRHAYHAGNFADVVKHAVLARILTYMKLKPQPFRVIDTHAGIGRYDLTGVESGKTSEWRDGIGCVIDCEMPTEVEKLLQPYLEAVGSVNLPGALTFYPGSPVIARHLMRPGDQLVANELHAEDFEALRTELRRTPDTKVLNLDAWVAVKALLPPPERRGVILIDPPFEDAKEFACLVDGLRNALQRFATGVYVIWYPVKDQALAERFVRDVSGLGAIKMLDVRLKLCEPFAGLGLTEASLLILNPPFNLRDELEVLMPFFVEQLGSGRGAGYRLQSIGD
jgi:23S rRNA (adenine2030-N6)-methyltransferase